jgi:hypothetical protein
MASAKRGMLVGAPQWWKHLRAWKRVFWKRQRRAEQQEIGREVDHWMRTKTHGAFRDEIYDRNKV